MATQHEKLARVRVDVTVEGETAMTVEGCVDLRGYPPHVLKKMGPELVGGIVRAAVLKLTPSLRTTNPERTHEQLMQISVREAEKDEEKARDDEVILVEDDEAPLDVQVQAEIEAGEDPEE